MAGSDKSAIVGSLRDMLYKKRMERQLLAAKGLIAAPERPPDEDGPGGSLPTAGSGKPGGWVPPSLRNRLGGEGGGGEMMQKRRDENSVRVSNLSEDVTEDDLAELFGPFGPIQRIFVAKDRETGAVGDERGRFRGGGVRGRLGALGLALAAAAWWGAAAGPPQPAAAQPAARWNTSPRPPPTRPRPQASRAALPSSTSSTARTRCAPSPSWTASGGRLCGGLRGPGLWACGCLQAWLAGWRWQECASASVLSRSWHAAERDAPACPALQLRQPHPVGVHGRAAPRAALGGARRQRMHAPALHAGLPAVACCVLRAWSCVPCNACSR